MLAKIKAVLLPKRRQAEATTPPSKPQPPQPKPQHIIKPPPFAETFILFDFPIIRLLSHLVRLLGYIVLDLARAIKNRDKKAHLFGIWCFVGLPGAGKTMSLVHYLDSQRRKYGEKIIIITNFYYAGQDAHLEDWKMMLKEYDRPVIFAWDELQNEFNSRGYKEFPIRLVHELTQNRKGHGKQVVYTTQTFTAVDKNFRSLTATVVDCRTYFKRLTTSAYYKREVYEARAEAKAIDRKIRNKPKRRERFLQTDYLRSRYNSYQRLDYLKGLEYTGLETPPPTQGA